FAVLFGGMFGPEDQGGALVYSHGLLHAFFFRDERTVAMISSAAAALTAIGVWFHWRRFMVPITIAAGAATAAALVLGLAVAAGPSLADHLLILVLVAGFAVFALAMWWDMGDRTRTTRRSDVAFWLHLLAAPMLVHPIFAMMGMLQGTAA